MSTVPESSDSRNYCKKSKNDIQSQGCQYLQSREHSMISEILFSKYFTMLHFDQTSSWLSASLSNDLQFWTILRVDSLRWQSQYFSSTCALMPTVCVIHLVVTACVPFSFCWITFLPSVNFFLRPVGVPRVPYQDAVGSPAVGFSKEGGNTVVLFPRPLSPAP